MATRLLRHCLGFGTVVYSARTTPCDFQERELQLFDDEAGGDTVGTGRAYTPGSG